MGRLQSFSMPHKLREETDKGATCANRDVTSIIFCGTFQFNMDNFSVFAIHPVSFNLMSTIQYRDADMDQPHDTHLTKLREEIADTEARLARLKSALASAENEAHQSKKCDDATARNWPLHAAEYQRYGRQLILPQIGIEGQKRIKSAKVLIIGAGGLGCPAAAYLAGAGVGQLAIFDGDTVEPSNLHRQIAHSTSRVGQYKVDSLITYCQELNPLVTYTPFREHLTPSSAALYMQDYDIVLDCTDNPASRYLISDAAVLFQKPLVSASALRTDGQLIVLNTPPTPQSTPSTSPQPPCYRCIFPKPPPAETVISCGEGGILGPVVGVMGVLQALEAIKILAAGLHLPAASSTTPPPPPTMLLFSGAPIGAPSFRSVRMRSRRKDCFACGQDSTLTVELLKSGSVDYVAFCGSGSAHGPGEQLAEEARISVAEYAQRRTGEDPQRHLLLDVREKELFDIASLEGAVNVPFSRIQSAAARGRSGDAWPEWMPSDVPSDAPIYVICRVGNDSQMVAKQLLDLGLGRDGERWIGDIRGGMRAWRDKVESTLPFL